MTYIERVRALTDEDLYVFNEKTAEVVNGACRELGIEEEKRECIECLRNKYFIVMDMVEKPTIITVNKKKYEWVGGRRLWKGMVIGRTSPARILREYYKEHKHKFREYGNV